MVQPGGRPSQQHIRSTKIWWFPGQARGSWSKLIPSWEEFPHAEMLPSWQDFPRDCPATARPPRLPRSGRMYTRHTMRHLTAFPRHRRRRLWIRRQPIERQQRGPGGTATSAAATLQSRRVLRRSQVRRGLQVIRLVSRPRPRSRRAESVRNLCGLVDVSNRASCRGVPQLPHRSPLASGSLDRRP